MDFLNLQTTGCFLGFSLLGAFQMLEILPQH